MESGMTPRKADSWLPAGDAALVRRAWGPEPLDEDDFEDLDWPANVCDAVFCELGATSPWDAIGREEAQPGCPGICAAYCRQSLMRGRGQW